MAVPSFLGPPVQAFESTPIVQTFDYFSKLEKPAITLCNPDYTEMYSLNSCYDTEIKLKWNAQSEFNFTFPRVIDGVTLDAYDYIEGKRIVLIENIGYFIINDVQEEFDGTVPIKTVNCLSHESQLVYKRVTLFTGTYSFDDLMTNVLTLAPGWEMGYTGSGLSLLSRTFNVSDTNVYQFLKDEVSIAFDCIFIFDYNFKRIYAIPSDYDSGETNVFLSFENLIKNTEYKEITTEITTCLYPYGGGDLTIRNVNPLGTNAIYNFTYYKTTEWMTQDLIDAIDIWEANIDSYRTQYSLLMIELAEFNDALTILEAELAELQAELASDQQVRAARIQQGLDTTEIDAEIVIDEQLIADKNVEIAAYNAFVSDNTLLLQEINNILSMTNTDNFTSTQYSELVNFIFENTYRNDNIIITDSMTYGEIQEQSQQLYDTAIDILAKSSIPRYQITIDSVNFIALQEYLVFINQWALGDQVIVDSGKGYFIDATLLEYDFSYDNLEEFTITLSNRKRLDDSHFIFTDLFGQGIQSANTLGFNSSNWNDWTSSKPIVLNQVIAPDGTLEYGIVAGNLKGTIDAKDDLAIKNTNSTTGSSNFSLDQYGVVLRDATLYSGSQIGTDGVITTAGGGTLFFSKGVYIGGTGITGSGLLYEEYDATGQTGSHITLTQTFLAGSTKVYLNGLVQRFGYNYSEGGDVQSITMFDSVLTDDVIVIEYIPLT